MTFEDRIRQAVDAALAGVRSKVEQELHATAAQVVSIAATEREHLVNETRQATLEQAAREAKKQIAEAEARVRASLDALVTEARGKEREAAAVEMRKAVEREVQQKLQEAKAAADKRLQETLASAEQRANQSARESVVAARVREREAEMAALSRLLDSIRGLDGAASLSEVLDALGQATAREAARAAVVVLRGDRLLGWRLSGFGPRDAQPKSIDLGLNESGVIGLAVGSGRPVTTRESVSAADGPGFAHLPADRMGLAVPVIVGGRVVAVVYADSVTHDGREQTVPSGWPEVIEVLARHAARCLEALTVQKTSTAPSPRFWVPPASQAGGAGNSSVAPGRTASSAPAPAERASAERAPAAPGTDPQTPRPAGNVTV